MTAPDLPLPDPNAPVVPPPIIPPVAAATPDFDPPPEYRRLSPAPNFGDDVVTRFVNNAFDFLDRIAEYVRETASMK